MRVSLVTETYFPQVNGVSRTLGQLVNHLRERGDEVQLIHPDYKQSTSDPNTLLVRSFTVPFYKELHLPLPPFGKVKRALNAFRPDVVHIATEATLGLTVLRHCLWHKIPTVSSFHTNFDQYSDHYRVGFLKGLIWRYLRWFHNKTRETYVPSRATIADLETRGFERLILWPRGVDSTTFRPDRPGRAHVRECLGFTPENVVVTYVSRIAAEKNIAYLAKALQDVASSRPDARFLFVGDGPERANLEAMMGPHAKFVGYRTGDELADYYAAGDIFAFSSLTETFGNVVLEAMASGMPVVALKAGGVGEIIRPGETGALIAPDEPSEVFASVVASLVDDAERRKMLAAGALCHARSQSWSEIMEALRTRYELAIAKA